MTIIATIKTGTDLVIAADSKVTTKGLGGFVNGEPIWLDQTYDFSTKIAFSKNKCLTVAAAGQISFGDIQVLDKVSEYDTINRESREEQHTDFMVLVNELNDIRLSYYRKMGIPDNNCPMTELIFAGADPEGRGVNVWSVTFQSSTPIVQEILKSLGVWLTGSAENAFTLMYNYNISSINEVAVALEMEGDGMNRAFNQLFSPVKKINFAPMPLQDAMDMAMFLAKVQIQMERFLPGNASCGGPIDIAVVHGLPKNEVKWFPGKELRYPSF